LLATLEGLLKTTNDQLIRHYYKGKIVRSLKHITDSVYLVGFCSYGLILWNEQTDQQISKIFDSDYSVFSIKRVMTTNNYIIKTEKGVEVVTIDCLTSLKSSVQHFFDAKESLRNYNDSLQLQITDSHIKVAVAQNYRVDLKWKSSIKFMEVPIAEMLGGKTAG
jgi:hypothetical protein